MRKKVVTCIAFIALAFIVSAPTKTQAASAWSFRSSSEQIKNNDTTKMTYYQYKNFDLLKNDVMVSESDDKYDDYTVRWKSSNEDAVWINKYTGQARANKFGTYNEDFGTVKISAVIKNTKTGKQIVRSFFVEVDNREFTQESTEPTTVPEATPTPEVVVTPSPTPTPVAEPEEAETVSYPKRGIKKLTLGSTWQTDMTVLMDTIDFFFEDMTLKPEHVLGIDSVDCVSVGNPAEKTYIRSISLKVLIQALNPNWENPNQYIIEKVDINHYFEIE